MRWPAHRIATEVPLAGVGKNLQDHISAGPAWARRDRGPFHGQMRIDRILRALAKAYLGRDGMAGDLPGGIMAFLKSRGDAALPDIQLLFNAAPMTAHPHLGPFRKPYEDGFSCRAVVLRRPTPGSGTPQRDPSRPSRTRSSPRMRRSGSKLRRWGR